MSDITLRLVKGLPLTNQEVDDNFANLNTDKYQAGDSASFQDVTLDNMSGPITWNVDDGTVDVPLNAQVTLQLGQEFVFYAKATEAIANGDVVMFAGAQGGHLLIAKCDMGAVGFDPSHIVGVATQSFAINDFGYVTSSGKVRGIDTSGFTEGTILYVDPTTAGGYTSTKPTPPNHIVQIAAVTRSHATQGTILTRVSHMPDTDEVPEGSTNLYFTDARAVSAIKADGDWNATNWNTAYGWGDHDGLYLPIDAVTLPDQTGHDGQFLTTNGTTADWATVDTSLGDTAYGWGDHSTEGYLTSFTETDPTVPSHVKSITTTNISNWNTAYGWGDHSTQNYAVTTGDTFTGDLDFGDNVKAKFGASDDLQIFHTGSYSAIRDVGTGALFIGGENYVDIGNAGASATYARFHKDDRVDLYHNNSIKLSTKATGVDIAGTITADGLTVAGSPEIDGSANGNVANLSFTRTDASWSLNNETNFRIYGNTGDTSSPTTKRMEVGLGGDFHLYEDTGTTAKFVWDASDESLKLGDGVKAKFGASDDLQIYHDGSNSFIKDTGDGILFVQGSGGVRVLGADTSESLARFNENGSVQLYHDNAEKLATTSTGVDVTGTVTATGGNSTNWNTAYSWGNHASAGYLTTHQDISGKANLSGATFTGPVTFTEQGSTFKIDPHTVGVDLYSSGNLAPHYQTNFTLYTGNIGTGVQKLNLDSSGNLSVTGTLSASGYNKTNWDTAYGWGNHASAGYLTSLPSHNHDDLYYTESEADSRFVNVTGDTMTGDLLVQDDIKSTGQIRATGWWNTNTGTSGHDLATEIGVSAGVSHILSYNRASSSYGNLNISAANVDFPQGNVSIGGATAWHSGNDGSGSGLDADLLDGQQGSYYNQSQFTGDSFYSSSSTTKHSTLEASTYNNVGYIYGSNPSSYSDGSIYTAAYSSSWVSQIFADYRSGNFWTRTKNSGTWQAFNKIWTSGNDGSGSGLDADLLDGNHASAFAPASHSHNYVTEGGTSFNGEYPVTVRTGTRTIYSDGNIKFRGSDSRLTVDGSVYSPSFVGALSGNATTATTASNANLLDNKDHTNFGATLATYGTTAGSSGRIRCTAPFATNSGHMFQVTVSVYSSYTCHTYVVSGYMYSSTNQWYSPKVVYSGTGSPDIYVGRDSSGKAYISIGNGSYTGVRVHNMTRGYQTSVADTYDPWTITINGGDENRVNPTVSKTWHSTNDGSGSGLDADLLDGQHASAFASSSHNHSQVYIPDTRGAARAPSYYPDRYTSFDFQNTSDTGAGGDAWHVLQTVAPWSTYNASHRQQQLAFTGTGGVKFRYATSDSAWAGWQTLWTSGNDGSGSGLDADLLDGVQGSYFYSPSNVGPSNSVNITGYGNSNFTYYQTSGNFNIHSGWHGYLVSNHGDGSNYYRQVIALPFWGSPTHSRLEGGTQRGIYNMWTAENDGSGSGLDADLLDGLQASAFINTASKNASGWHKCTTTGVIIQWARIYVSANSTTYWTFPTAFPSACRSISANQESSNAGIGDNSQFYSISRTGATLRNGWNSSATYFTVFAIGY